MNPKFRSQIITFIICVLAACFIWLVIKLSKDFTSIITYEVEYVNVPEGQILVNTSASELTLEIDARGADLFTNFFLKKKPKLLVDLSGIIFREDNGSFNGFLPTTALNRKLALQLGSYNELLYIQPDTLKFEFKPEYKKKVPVALSLKYQLRPQHMLYEPIKMIPDSIWIYGPEEILAQISQVSTLVTEMNDLHQDVLLNLELLKPEEPSISYPQHQVEVQIKVEKFTEKTFELPINVVCEGQDFSIRIFPETVKVSCIVALKDYKRVEAVLFEATVNCQGAEISSQSRLRVEMVKHPSYVTITQLEPERVEYIMVKSLN